MRQSSDCYGIATAAPASSELLLRCCCGFSAEGNELWRKIWDTGDRIHLSSQRQNAEAGRGVESPLRSPSLCFHHFPSSLHFTLLSTNECCLKCVSSLFAVCSSPMDRGGRFRRGGRGHQQQPHGRGNLISFHSSECNYSFRERGTRKASWSRKSWSPTSER